MNDVKRTNSKSLLQKLWKLKDVTDQRDYSALQSWQMKASKVKTVWKKLRNSIRQWSTQIVVLTSALDHFSNLFQHFQEIK